MTSYSIDQLLSSGNSYLTISLSGKVPKGTILKSVTVSPLTINSMILNLPSTVEKELSTVINSSGLLLSSLHATAISIFGSNVSSAIQFAGV